jgi:hypothetical protein
LLLQAVELAEMLEAINQAVEERVVIEQQQAYQLPLAQQ